MRVRVLVTLPGASYEHSCGRVVEVPDSEGAALIDAGRAEAAEARPTTARPRAGEQAVKGPRGEKRG